MKHVRFLLLFLGCMIIPIHQYPDDSLKGIWTEIKKFPLFNASFWEGLGRSFGAPPTGYVYSYSVYNDSVQPIWVAQSRMISLMGGYFPGAGGWSLHPDAAGVQPGAHVTQTNQDYYFEMLIKTTPNSYSNNMPYLQHDDVLYQQDAIALLDEHSKKHHYFRVYVGKQLSGGAYQYVPKAEYIGYTKMDGSKDANAIKIGSSMSSLVIKNSTKNDYAIGFSSTPGLTTATMKRSACLVFATVAMNSFATLATFGTIQSFRPGTVGVFDVASESCIAVLDVAPQGFEGMTHTLEIHDETGTVMATWQGLASGHFDMPMNRIRDITPIEGYFWYKKASNAKTEADLPGTVWVVALGLKPEILAMAKPGQAVQFKIMRPEVEQKKPIYFLYVDSIDPVMTQKFVQGFLSGIVGAKLIADYKVQTDTLMSQAALHMQPAQAALNGVAAATQVSPVLMSQAVDGSLQMNRGQIIDPATGLTGYLLGSDQFLPVGIGAVPMYYSLDPSWPPASSGALILPTSSVANLFAMEQITSAPSGMPTPIMSTYVTSA